MPESNDVDICSTGVDALGAFVVDMVSFLYFVIMCHIYTLVLVKSV